MTPKFEHVLLLLTVVAGAVDAISYLALGHVFVVNMTGNIIFLGFAAAGSTAVSLRATAIALAGFVAGSAAGGRLAARHGSDMRGLLRHAAWLKTSLVVAAVATVLIAAGPFDPVRRDVVIALLSLAMGVQNATARRVGIPDLTTTVLTLTLTALAAESPLGGGRSARNAWRSSSVLAMLAGAFAGALFVLHLGLAAALAFTAVLLLIAGLGTRALASRAPAPRVA